MLVSLDNVVSDSEDNGKVSRTRYQANHVILLSYRCQNREAIEHVPCQNVSSDGVTLERFPVTRNVAPWGQCLSHSPYSVTTYAVLIRRNTVLYSTVQYSVCLS